LHFKFKVDDLLHFLLSKLLLDFNIEVPFHFEFNIDINDQLMEILFSSSENVSKCNFNASACSIV
jgi:hypothetical protein